MPAMCLFVSVTQQFNTTTSMGRLTLNVLLSFAQFEREVTAERIRDKIAASKKKGMWMGGRVPFGYRAEERKLHIDGAAAETVRWMFDRYLVLKSVAALTKEIERSGKMAQVNSDIGMLSRGKIFYLLANPIYIGKLRHHGQILNGDHPAIVETELFDRVQQELKRSAPKRRSRSNREDVHLLTGLLFDVRGDRLSPTHTNNHGKRYRYYVSSALVREETDGPNQGWRIPAVALETLVLSKLRDVLANRLLLSNWQQANAVEQSIEAVIRSAQRLSDQVAADQTGILKRKVISAVFAKISISATALSLSLNPQTLIALSISRDSLEDEVLPTGLDGSSRHMIEVPITIKRRGHEHRIVIESQLSLGGDPDQALIDLVGRAHSYLDALTKNGCKSIADLAAQRKIHPADISRVLPLAFLAPTITSAIFDGSQHSSLTAQHLARLIVIPPSWAQQKAILNS